MIVLVITFRNKIFVFIFYEGSDFTLKNHTDFLVTCVNIFNISLILSDHSSVSCYCYSVIDDIILGYVKYN
jgi:hypothetical protein